MRKLAIAGTAALFTLTATAQQPLQCLNPDILNGAVFLGRSDRKVEVTRGLPAFMSGFRAPADFSLIGSGVYEDGQSMLIAYKTPLASDQAYAAAVAALGAEGWTVLATRGAAQVFNVVGTPREGTLCRNGEPRSLQVADVAGARYVGIHAFPGSRNPGCGALDLTATMRGGPGDVAPRLQFPAGTSLTQSGVGGGGSSKLFTTTTRIISSETPAALVAHLASQLQGQGWRPDTDWSGTNGAGSTWRTTVDGEFVWGTLEINRVSEGTYDLDFTMALAQ